LRLFSFGGYGLALAALALVVFGAIECPPFFKEIWKYCKKKNPFTKKKFETLKFDFL